MGVFVKDSPSPRSIVVPIVSRPAFSPEDLNEAPSIRMSGKDVSADI
jgi:hypothetical protein